VPIPTNWQAESSGDYAILTSPDAQIEVYVVVVPGEAVEEAIADAWATVDPSFDAPVLDVNEIPPGGGIERLVSVDYDTEEGSDIAAAVGMLANGNVYALLFRGDFVAISQRAAQLTIIQSGLEIAGVEEVELAGVPALPFDEAMRAEFESYIQRKLDEFGVPGAAVAVVQDGEIVYAQGFGVRALDGDEPVTAETQMMIGSTGKTMTTMMMATVVDDGLMAWDTPVQEVLPQFAVADAELSQTITMRNLVCACTGVPRRDWQLLFNASDLSAEDIIESLQEFEFFTEFGEAFQYSNQLVATGGYAAAAAAGAEWGNLFDAYGSEMQERVFDPIGMDSTTLSFDAVINSGNYAMPHSLGMETPYELMPLEDERVVLPVAPAGAHWSNVMDMGRYLLTELNRGVAPDGTRVVSEENLAETWVPQVPVSAESSYGLGWFVDQYKGQPMMQHGGNTLGFSSDLAFLPEVGVGITVISNGRVTDAFNQAVRFRLLEMLFAQPMEFDAQADFIHESIRESMMEAVEDTLPIDEAAVRPFLDNYSNSELGELALELEDGALYADVGEFRMEVRSLAPDEEAGDEEAGEAGANSQPGENEYVIFDAPFAGLPLQLERAEDEQPQVRLGQGVNEYLFTPAE
jgi:CubicO group peptidase (beta-lactamase class C family)